MNNGFESVIIFEDYTNKVEFNSSLENALNNIRFENDEHWKDNKIISVHIYPASSEKDVD